MDDRQFKQLLDWFELSWAGYYRVRKGVKKRIRKHMQECACRSVDDYLSKLAGDTKLREQCRVLLTVSISRFFRDQGLWQVLEKDILPALITREHGEIGVWSAGCARGEEIYSFKILWDILSERLDSVPKLQARATDMNPEYIKLAREGIYSASSLKGISNELKGRYFRRISKKQLFVVQDSVKFGILWDCLDLLKDNPPLANFHMIFLRNNILTYYEKAPLQAALSNVTGSLLEGGYLIIGSKERLPATAEQLHPHPGHSSIFVKWSAGEQAGSYPKSGP